MTTFIAMRAVECSKDGISIWKQATTKHFNPDYIVNVDENKMLIEMSNGVLYRINEESLQMFLSTIYAEVDDADGGGV
jgi:hypothetical protein